MRSWPGEAGPFRTEGIAASGLPGAVTRGSNASKKLQSPNRQVLRFSPEAAAPDLPSRGLATGLPALPVHWPPDMALALRAWPGLSPSWRRLPALAYG